MGGMDDLGQWLRSQLDEDERDAKARRGIFPSPAVLDDGAVCLHIRPGGNMAITWYRNPAEGWDDMAKLRNWADTENGWTQERVLREIEADRALIADYLAAQETVDAAAHPDMYDVGRAQGLEEAMRRRASAYDHRPGYREEWRP